MSGQFINVKGRKVWILDDGRGAPLLYLHGFADVHSVKERWMPFHERLLESARVIAPAHPGCAKTDENEDLDSIEDVVFHYLEVIDGLGLERFNLVGVCMGGWIAVEIAVRHPEKIVRLALIGALGLFVPGAHIGDMFMMAQPERGMSYAGLREMLFSSAHNPLALELFPDGRGEIEDEIRRYQMLRFASRIGFRPPYFYNRALRNRLSRISPPALVLWGEHDHLVPLAHGEAYAEGIPSAQGLKIVKEAGHSAHVENPESTGNILAEFLAL